MARRESEDQLDLLMEYIEDENFTKIKLILKENPKQLINKKNEDGTTPLIFATWVGKLEIVKLLVENGAHVNDKELDTGTTAILTASSKGYYEILRFLLTNGANKESEDNKSQTPLIKACQNGHLDIVKFLLKLDVNIDTKDRFGHSALFYASNVSLANYLDIVKELMKHNPVIEPESYKNVWVKAKVLIYKKELEKIRALVKGSLQRKETTQILRNISMMATGSSINFILGDNAVNLQMLRPGFRVSLAGKHLSEVIKDLPKRPKFYKEKEFKAMLRTRSEELIKKEKKNSKGRFSVDLTTQQTKKLERLIMRPFVLAEKELAGNVVYI